MADCDIGEMFINFMLSEEVRLFCGTDVTNASREDKWEIYRSREW